MGSQNDRNNLDLARFKGQMSYLLGRLQVEYPEYSLKIPLGRLIARLNELAVLQPEQGWLAQANYDNKYDLGLDLAAKEYVFPTRGRYESISRAETIDRIYKASRALRDMIRTSDTTKSRCSELAYEICQVNKLLGDLDCECDPNVDTGGEG